MRKIRKRKTERLSHNVLTTPQLNEMAVKGTRLFVKGMNNARSVLDCYFNKYGKRK